MMPGKASLRQVITRWGASVVAKGKMVGSCTALGGTAAVGQHGRTPQVIGQEVEEAVVAGVGIIRNPGGNRLSGQAVRTALNRAYQDKVIITASKPTHILPLILLLFFVVRERIVGNGFAYWWSMCSAPQVCLICDNTSSVISYKKGIARWRCLFIEKSGQLDAAATPGHKEE